MKDQNNKNVGLRKLLLRHFLIFLVLVLVITSAWIFIGIREWDNFYQGIQPSKMAKLEKQLIKGDYDSDFFKPYNSYGTFFEIISYDNGLVYSSDESKSYEFTERELKLILPYDADYYYTRMSYVSPESGKKRYLIQKVKHLGSRYLFDSFDAIQEEFAYLLDSQLRLISSAEPTTYQGFSSREIDIMTHSFEGDYHLYRYDFISESGEKKAFVIFKDFDLVQRRRALNDHIIKFTILLLSSIILVILLLTWSLYRHISHPLNLLQTAILKLRNKELLTLDECASTPKELVEIFGTFNKVSSELHRSEQLREELEKSKQKLIADIFHDLRTPITVIKGYSEAILNQIIAGETKEKYLNIIYQKSIILEDLIKSLGEFSKLQHPDFELRQKRVDFSEYLRHYWAKHYDELELAGYVLDITIPEMRYDVVLDSAHFDRVLDNLLNNFMKYNPKGTTLFFMMTMTDGKISLEIADDGVKLSPKLSKDLFTPFVTGSDSRTSGEGGTGLGLAIVQQLIEKHKGTISLDTANKRYAKKFTIVLPLAD